MGWAQGVRRELTCRMTGKRGRRAAGSFLPRCSMQPGGGDKSKGSCTTTEGAHCCRRGAGYMHSGTCKTRERPIDVLLSVGCLEGIVLGVVASTASWALAVLALVDPMPAPQADLEWSHRDGIMSRKARPERAPRQESATAASTGEHGCKGRPGSKRDATPSRSRGKRSHQPRCLTW